MLLFNSCFQVIYTNITSCEVEGMRLICMRSMFMIANLTTFELKITPIIVKTSKEQQKHDIPLHLLETSSFVLNNQKPSSDLKYVWFNILQGNRFWLKYYCVSVHSSFCSLFNFFSYRVSTILFNWFLCVISVSIH